MAATTATASKTSTSVSSAPPTRGGQVLAWGVHLLTASGAVLGALALLAIAAGDLAHATLLMLLALAIDSFDGTLARAVGVSRQLPEIDGRRLDDIVDYLNFVIVPAVFLVQAGSLLSPGWIALPILASACGFSRVDAKTEDDFFLGFPSYWNILAFYLWLLEFSPLAGTLWVAGLSAAVFVPFKYIYPSKLRSRVLRYGMSWGGGVWAVVLGLAVLFPETARRFHAVELSLAYPVLYLALSFMLGGLQPSSRKRAVAP